MNTYSSMAVKVFAHFMFYILNIETVRELVMFGIINRLDRELISINK